MNGLMNAFVKCGIYGTHVWTKGKERLTCTNDYMTEM